MKSHFYGSNRFKCYSNGCEESFNSPYTRRDHEVAGKAEKLIKLL